jgi:adenylate kinase
MWPNLHIFGIQGSGKDTQAAKLAQHYGLQHISSGDLVRARAHGGDEIAQQLDADLHKGRLIDDNILFALVDQKLRQLDGGIVGAGVIRTLTQHDHFSALWSSLNLDEPFAIELKISEELARERVFSRLRSDDTEEALRERFLGN